MAETKEITWDPEADRRIRRSPFLMRRFIRKRIEDRVASRGRDHVTEADVDESAGMYRQYRFKVTKPSHTHNKPSCVLEPGDGETIIPSSLIGDLTEMLRAENRNDVTDASIRILYGSAKPPDVSGSYLVRWIMRLYRGLYLRGDGSHRPGKPVFV